MFGMNAKDAQGLLEDMMVLNTHNQSLDDTARHNADMRRLARESQEDMFAANIAAGVGMAVMAFQSKQKAAQINELRDVLTKTQAALQRSITAHITEKKARDELAIAASAALATINALVETENDQSRAQHLYTNHYNAGVDWMMSHGHMKEDEDPRLSGRFTGQSWYIAGV